jgi:hypothetical protein
VKKCTINLRISSSWALVTDWVNPLREETFAWSQVRRAVLSPQTLLTASAYFGLLTAIYSFGLFVSSVQVPTCQLRADKCSFPPF